MNLTLKVWRQDGPGDAGRFETYQATDVKDEMSFLEMLDVVNENLIADGHEPITFDSDCREGICGTCGLMINGQAHGPQKGTATCQLHMRKRDANEILVPKSAADTAMDAAACIGCGACVAACPNGAAQLFTSAKLAHLNLLPQGQSERWKRTEDMVETMEMFFGSCTNYGECQEACPKEIPIDFIALMNRDYLKSKIKNRKLQGQR